MCSRVAAGSPRAEGRDRQRLAGLEELGRILGPLGQREEPLGQLPRFPEFGAYLVIHPQSPEHREEQRGLRHLFAQRAGAGVGALRFRGRVTLGDLQLHTQGHLQGEFAACAVGRVRQRLEQRQPPPRQRHRLVVGEDAGSVLRRHQIIVGGTLVIAPRLEQHRQFGGQARALLPVMTQEGPSRGRAPRRLSRRLERGVQGILIEHVDEAVTQRQRPVGERLLPDEPDHEVDALQHLQPLLHVRRLPTQHLGHHRRVKLRPLHAGRHQQVAVGTC